MAISIKNTYRKKEEVWPEFMPNSGNDIIEKDGRSIYYIDIDIQMYICMHVYIFFITSGMSILRGRTGKCGICA